MRAGRLDRRVTIEQLTETQNGVGETIKTWSTLATLWAERVPQGVVQKYNTQQQYAEVTAVFRIRWFPHASAISPELHRVVYRDRVYDVHGTEEIGRRDGLMILTAARADNEPGSA